MSELQITATKSSNTTLGSQTVGPGSLERLLSPLLTFIVGEEWCAIASNEVEEVLMIPELISPADTPSFIEGYFDLNRLAVPVLHLNRILQLPEKPIRLNTPLIRVDYNGKSTAFVVTEIGEIIPKGVSARKLPVSETRGCVSELLVMKDRSYSLIDLGALLLESEARLLEDYREREKARLDNLSEMEE